MIKWAEPEHFQEAAYLGRNGRVVRDGECVDDCVVGTVIRECGKLYSC